MIIFFTMILAAGLYSVIPALAAENSTDIFSRISDQQKQLAADREELARISKSLADHQRVLDQQRSDLADANSQLRDAEDRYRDSVTRFGRRVSAIYKLGEGEFYAVLLSSDNFSDSVSRLSYLGTISENDRKMIERVRADEQEVRELHARVDSIKQSSAADYNALLERQAQLQSVIASGQGRIDSDYIALTQAQTREQEQAARKAAEQASYQVDSFSMYGGVMGPSMQVGSGPPAGLQPTGIVLSGQSSWYGPGFHGNRTANGEIYNMYAMTAAHKTLPFGTWLKVTYSGRSVFVRINDRGPYVGARILDLSAGSAQAIGLTGVGYIQAEIYR
ncbi:MAG: septal ring lytic transglycosylase RlpA family protein [Thermoleophilia bacterium]